MSLFQFGFTRASSCCDTENGTQEPLDIPTYLRNTSECGLGVEEHSIVTKSASELADPEPSQRKRKTCGKYTEFFDEDHVKIGRYACENGNERVQKRFLKKFPRLTESTVRNFKTKYIEKMRVERRRSSPQPVTRLFVEQILLELDTNHSS